MNKFIIFQNAFACSTTALVNHFKDLVCMHSIDFSFFDSREITSPDYYQKLSGESKEEFKRVLASIVIEGKKSIIEDVMILLGEPKIWIKEFKQTFSSGKN